MREYLLHCVLYPYAVSIESVLYQYTWVFIAMCLRFDVWVIFLLYAMRCPARCCAGYVFAIRYAIYNCPLVDCAMCCL